MPIAVLWCICVKHSPLKFFQWMRWIGEIDPSGNGGGLGYWNVFELFKLGNEKLFVFLASSSLMVEWERWIRTASFFSNKMTSTFLQQTNKNKWKPISTFLTAAQMSNEHEISKEHETSTFILVWCKNTTFINSSLDKYTVCFRDLQCVSWIKNNKAKWLF